ncbi:MAG: quinolinate synthase NadA, partial [Candidatus Omnitrophica bacterium]|nr:quinolinate synthase NadA [Candidatus Omnitrophota bacterium]
NILSHKKSVLIPDFGAGCPMADMMTVEQLRQMKKEHPKAKVVCYVNSSAEVKAECDVCCTSANAVEILQKMFTEKDEILFVPDKFLGSYAAKKAKRNVIVWNGYCPTHAKMMPEEILKLKSLHPDAKVMVHPECPAPVVKLADEVLSTSGTLRYTNKSDAKEFIVATEKGMLHPLKKENPNKKFYAVSDLAICPNMKKITLEKVLHSLEHMEYQIELPQETISRAWGSIKRMLEY